MDKKEKLDYKKEYKDLYMPKSQPGIIDVPKMNFIMVDGRGNPNIEGDEYQKAVELLYALSFTIKMSKMGKNIPEGYYEYVVPPLEGLWWMEDDSSMDFSQKDNYCWTSMIRQPEFVTQEVFFWACGEVKAKKPQIDTSKARLQSFTEGLCVQLLHIGPYDDEWISTKQMDLFTEENNYQNAISDVLPDGTILRHHEIYLGDPRKTAPSKLKTVLRHPVKHKL
jgi:Uncharacterized conserved protein